MGFLENFFLPPSASHLHLVKYMILLVYFIHFPFISLMIGGTTLSLFFRLVSKTEENPTYLKFSDDLTDKLIFGKLAGIILGVLPLIILLLIEGQVFYDAEIPVLKFMIYTALLVATGIMLVYFYKNMLRLFPEKDWMAMGAGATGLLFLMVGYFIFSSATALILDPGRWYLVNSLSDLMFSWNVAARGVHYLTASLAVSGAAMLFFFFNWQESAEELTEDYAEFVRKVAGGITMAFLVIQPVFIFWNLATMPVLSLSTGIFILSVIAVLLLLITTRYVFRLLAESELHLGSKIFTMFVVIFLLMITNDHLAREKATENHSNLLTTRSNELMAEIKSRREIAKSASIKVDMNIGKQVFNGQCLSCHQMDKAVVGPSYNSVMPKYAGNEEDLKNYIRKPVKVDANYPSMPQLGLSEQQIKSVAAYLLKTYEEGQAN